MDPLNLARFHQEFWHDLDRSQLKPVEDYVRKFPDCAAEIEKEYEHAKATGSTFMSPDKGLAAVFGEVRAPSESVIRILQARTDRFARAQEKEPCGT